MEMRVWLGVICLSKNKGLGIPWYTCKYQFVSSSSYLRKRTIEGYTCVNRYPEFLAEVTCTSCNASSQWACDFHVSNPFACCRNIVHTILQTNTMTLPRVLEDNFPTLGQVAFRALAKRYYRPMYGYLLIDQSMYTSVYLKRGGFHQLAPGNHRKKDQQAACSW